MSDLPWCCNNNVSTLLLHQTKAFSLILSKLTLVSNQWCNRFIAVTQAMSYLHRFLRTNKVIPGLLPYWWHNFVLIIYPLLMISYCPWFKTNDVTASSLWHEPCHTFIASSTPMKSHLPFFHSDDIISCCQIIHYGWFHISLGLNQGTNT